jgi:adenosylmethionine-8-amino-7-oxononanoate aminotransferase
VNSEDDPLWEDCSCVWKSTQLELESLQDHLCAIVVEPIVQGASGLRLYSKDFIKRLSRWAKAHNIYLIADEIMTGLGRTGTWFACEHADVQPDLMCLSKGLTSGSIPMSCVLIDHDIYTLFYKDDLENSFLHSHTYSGNPLAVSAALATIKIMMQENIPQKAMELGHDMKQCFEQLAQETGRLKNVRSLGAWVAGDLIAKPGARMGYRVFQEGLKQGAFLRPLGNTLYWLPPLNTPLSLIQELMNITRRSIKAAYAPSST